MATIKAIEGRSVHQIQSGQVISDGLTSAVKELVENSLDAHATSIDIRFKNYGLDSLEVADNGDGIGVENFESLALKHYTSKLTTYDDLESVTTFGFRGEALSSLCALSILSVTTATKDVAPKGSKLEFEISGKLKSTSVTAASKGTTVAVEHLFKTLPVRRRELERNIKRDYAKVLNFLQAYAVICTNVKFAVSNTVNGKKTIAFATKANKTTKENISNVFGAKTTVALVPLDLEFELSGQTSSLRSICSDNKKVRITGHISRPVVGEGRQAPDRQMFYVNSRPCTLPQVSRAFNEIYKSYNVTQSPFIFADMHMDTNSYDVNVSPDKRTILLHDQSALLEALKIALTDMFEDQEQTVPSAVQTKQTPLKQLMFNRPTRLSSSLAHTADPTEEEDGNGEEIATPSLVSKVSKMPDRFTAHDKPTAPITELFTKFGQGTVQELVEERAEKTRTGLTFQQKSKIANVLSKRHVESTSSNDATDKDNSESEKETPHPKPKTPRKEQPLISPARARMAQMIRPEPEPTTITIGSTTIVTTPTRPGRRGLGENASQNIPSRSSPLKITSTKISGAFVNRLRGLAAPGTQLEVVSGALENHEVAEVAEARTGKNDNEPQECAQISTARVRKHAIRRNKESAPQTITAEKASEYVHTDKVDDIEDDIGDDIEDDTEDDIEEKPARGEPERDDEDYIDAAEQQDKERATVDRLIREAEEEEVRPTAKALDRFTASISAKSNKKDSTVHLIRNISASLEFIQQDFSRQHAYLAKSSLTSTKRRNSQAVPQSRSTELEENNTAAEERLSLTIHKSDFAKMRIVGQFNLGFILATKPTSTTSDLFIIDQHASDEKYNFERLQSETVVQNQPLVRPRTLELTAMEELIVIDNLETFRRNGFIIEVNDEADTGERCQLVSLPMSKGTTFDVKDLEELIHLVHQSPNDASVRPAKVRSMFAMRACRSSIMIGKTLNFKTMKEVVGHMGELDKPWNCPHGRPTMRHVKDLKSVDIWKGDMDGIEWDKYAAITDDEVDGGEYEEGGDEGSGYDSQEPEEGDIDDIPEDEDILWQDERDVMLEIESVEV